MSEKEVYYTVEDRKTVPCDDLQEAVIYYLERVDPSWWPSELEVKAYTVLDNPTEDDFAGLGSGEVPLERRCDLDTTVWVADFVREHCSSWLSHRDILLAVENLERS